MTKSEFLSILADGLKDFPDRELADIIFDYQEHFTSGFSNGRTEEEIINELGDPHELVNQYRSAYLERVQNENTENNNTNSFETNSNTIDDTATFYGDVIYESVTDSEEAHDESKESTNTNSYDNDNKDCNNKKQKKGILRNFSVNSGGLLKILLIGLLLLISFPVLLAIGGFSFAIFVGFISMLVAIAAVCIGVNIFGISILLAKVGLVVLGASNTPNFITDFPTASIVLFVIGSLALTILFIMLIYYFLKLVLSYVIKLIKKIFGKGAN